MQIKNQFNPIYYSLDLEMNQPSRKIIQIGVCIGNLVIGEILEKISYYINPHEQLSPFIITLTGITQEQVESDSLGLDKAWNEIKARLNHFKAHYSPITWGCGDLLTLKSQLSDITKCRLAHRELDIKTHCQFNWISRQESTQSGLGKAMKRFRLQFQGTKHNALDDAINTFLFAHKLLFKSGLNTWK